MRVLSVVPRYAVTVGSLKARRGGTVIGKTREERGNCIYSSRRSTLVEEESSLIQGVLIHGMCIFRVRAARRRESERRA